MHETENDNDMLLIYNLNIYRDCNLFGFSNVKNQREGSHALCYILKWGGNDNDDDGDDNDDDKYGVCYNVTSMVSATR